MMNAMVAIHPYKHQGLWVFDDEQVGLQQEPFVSGADTMIDRMVQNIPDATAGFTLLFSANKFPGADARFEWRREEDGGNWYYNEDLELEGWLCPALFKYFDAAPTEIWAKFQPRQD